MVYLEHISSGIKLMMQGRGLKLPGLHLCTILSPLQLWVPPGSQGWLLRQVGRVQGLLLLQLGTTRGNDDFIRIWFRKHSCLSSMQSSSKCIKKSNTLTVSCVLFGWFGTCTWRKCGELRNCTDAKLFNKFRYSRSICQASFVNATLEVVHRLKLTLT